MKISWTSVRKPKWADKDKSMIDCLVKFQHLKVEVPFTAAPHDSLEHGRILFAECMSGKYGLIGDFNSEMVEKIGNPSNSGVPSELQDFIDQLNSESKRGSFRAQIILSASMLELSLNVLIKSFLIDHSVSKKMCEDPNLTFSFQIDLAFSLGIITKKESSLCHHIKTIRNIIAHQHSVPAENSKFTISIKSIYEQDHSDFYEWNNDLNFQIAQFYVSTCVGLIMKCVLRVDEIKGEKRNQRQNS